MMHIQTPVPSSDQKFLGRAKLELIHPRTGKSLKTVESENYISDALLNHNRWRQRQEYRNTVTNNDPELSPSILERVVLSTSNLVLPTGDIFAPGQITAWASPSSGVSDGPRRGSLTSGESGAYADHTTYTFEWPTTVGNGFIRSVYWGWVSTVPSVFDPQSHYNAGLPTAGSTNHPACWYDGAGGLWMITASHTLSKFNWAPTYENTLAGASLAFNGPTAAQMGLTAPYDIVGDGTNLYVVGTGAANIRKFATPTGSGDVTESAVTVTGLTAPTALAYDGTYLWAGFNGTTVYRVNKSTGSIERSLNVASPFGNPISLTWHSSKNLLLVAYWNGSGKYYFIRGFDLDGNIICEWYISGNGSATPANGLGFTYVGTVTDSRQPGFSYDGFLARDANLTLSNNSAPGQVFMPGPIATFTNLGTEVEKTNLTGMKLTYTFTFS